MEKQMKLSEAKPIINESNDTRYQVTLTTNVNGIELYWRTKVNAMSPQQALQLSQDIFKKYRKNYQNAMLRKWDIDEVTPITGNKG